MAGKGIKKLVAILILLISLSVLAVIGFLVLEKNNVQLQEGKNIVLIPSGSTYEELVQILEESGFIKDMRSFNLTARALNLRESFHCGRYRITKGMNNRQLVKMFKNGKTEKVKLVLNSSYRTEDDIIDRLDEKFEFSSNDMRKIFEDESNLQSSFKLNRESFRTIFLPGNYEFEWTLTAEELLNKLKENHKEYWSDSKLKKIKRSGLSAEEVYILASIVQQESGIVSEQKKIAGVYLNRLQKNMPLQADPTLIFANGDFSVQRVLFDDKQIDSPYNTYKRKGLPPGPICIPYASAIDAVINYEAHNYLYFCAKPELNGYSNYAVSFEEHQKFAKLYREEMDRRGINR